MSQYPNIVITHQLGNTVTIPNQLFGIRAFTYLTDNKAAGTTLFPVDNASDFVIVPTTTPVLVGSMGGENTELLPILSISPTSIGTSASIQPHNRGDTLSQVRYDQVRIYKSATVNGVYGLIATITMQVTQQNTIYYDSFGLTTDFYKVEWFNSIVAQASSQSTPISVATYPVNSVANIIYPVLTAMGVSENDPKINTTFLISAVNDARKYTHAKLYGIRQDWQAKFEHPIKLFSGNNFVDLPTDIDFNITDRSLLAARFLIGNVLTPYNMRYIDKRTWNQVSFSVQGSYSATDTLIGAITIDVDNVGDFPSSGGGVAYIAATNAVELLMQISYTGVNVLLNQLTGVTGVTRNFPTGTRVWSNPTIAQPICYTVYDDKIYFDRIVPDSMAGNNVYIDYYFKIDEITDLYQELPEHYRYIYAPYLRWAIKFRKDISLPSSDPDLVKFEGLVEALYNNLYSGQDSIIITS